MRTTPSNIITNPGLIDKKQLNQYQWKQRPRQWNQKKDTNII